MNNKIELVVNSLLKVPSWIKSITNAIPNITEKIRAAIANDTSLFIKSPHNNGYWNVMLIKLFSYLVL